MNPRSQEWIALEPGLSPVSFTWPYFGSSSLGHFIWATCYTWEMSINLQWSMFIVWQLTSANRWLMGPVSAFVVPAIKAFCWRTSIDSILIVTVEIHCVSNRILVPVWLEASITDTSWRVAVVIYSKGYLKSSNCSYQKSEYRLCHFWICWYYSLHLKKCICKGWVSCEILFYLEGLALSRWPFISTGLLCHEAWLAQVSLLVYHINAH